MTEWALFVSAFATVAFLVVAAWCAETTKATAAKISALVGIGFGLLFIGTSILRLAEKIVAAMGILLVLGSPVWAASPRCQSDKVDQVEVIVLEGLPSTATKDRVERAAVASAEEWPEGTTLDCKVVMAISGDMQKQAIKRAKGTRCPMAVVFGHRSREEATTRATYSSAEQQVIRLPGSGEHVEEASVALCTKVAP